MKGWTRAEEILKAITWDMFGLRLCIFAHFIIFHFPTSKTCREDGFSPPLVPFPSIEWTEN